MSAQLHHDYNVVIALPGCEDAATLRCETPQDDFDWFNAIVKQCATLTELTTSEATSSEQGVEEGKTNSISGGFEEAVSVLPNSDAEDRDGLNLHDSPSAEDGQANIALFEVGSGIRTTQDDAATANVEAGARKRSACCGSRRG